MRKPAAGLAAREVFEPASPGGIVKTEACFQAASRGTQRLCRLRPSVNAGASSEHFAHRLANPTHRSHIIFMEIERRHPALRVAQLVLGVILIIGAGVIGPIPGPGGIFLFAGGMILILRNSRWAQRQFARWKRRWPKTGHVVDLTMRRGSAIRRRARSKGEASTESAN
jgi:hypothetical protein